jgi:hypothetical protein
MRSPTAASRSSSASTPDSRCASHESHRKPATRKPLRNRRTSIPENQNNRRVEPDPSRTQFGLKPDFGQCTFESTTAALLLGNAGELSLERSDRRVNGPRGPRATRFRDAVADPAEARHGGYYRPGSGRIQPARDRAECHEAAPGTRDAEELGNATWRGQTRPSLAPINESRTSSETGPGRSRAGRLTR